MEDVARVRFHGPRALRALVVVGAFGGAAVLITGCGGDNNGTTAATTTTTPATTTPATSRAPASTSPAPASVCQANPDPATSAFLAISGPAPNASSSSPLPVSGTIAAFEATFQMTIKDASGADLATKTGHSAQGQTLSSFNESVPFTVSTPTPACLWVFQVSAEDGATPTKVGQVPITLLP